MQIYQWQNLWQRLCKLNFQLSPSPPPPHSFLHILSLLGRERQCETTTTCTTDLSQVILVAWMYTVCCVHINLMHPENRIKLFFLQLHHKSNHSFDKWHSMELLLASSECIVSLRNSNLTQLIKVNGSISVSGQLHTYPSPNSTLTLTCFQLTVVELGEG